MPAASSFAAIFALAVIALIGFDMLLRGPKRREDRAGPTMLPGDVDPANLRRRRPLTERLSGVVLIAAAAVLYFVIRPALGF